VDQSTAQELAECRHAGEWTYRVGFIAFETNAILVELEQWAALFGWKPSQESLRGALVELAQASLTWLRATISCSLQWSRVELQSCLPRGSLRQGGGGPFGPILGLERRSQSRVTLAGCAQPK
jgi:hypothetical protein